MNDTTVKSKIKKIIAAIVGIEIGLLIVAVTFITLIGYLVVGLLSYLVNFIIPIEDTILQNIIGVIISVFIVSASVFYCLVHSEKLYSYFKWLVVVIPLICGLMYLLLFPPTNKSEEINEELKKYNAENRIARESDRRIISELESKLTKISQKLDSSSNLYLGIFSTNANRVDSISIDRIFLSHLDSLGLCVYTARCGNFFNGATFFFNPTNLTIYCGANLAGSYGETRKAALKELYYELYILKKTRKRAVYTPSLKNWQEIVPSILDSNYWSTTIKEDTINMTMYGKI